MFGFLKNLLAPPSVKMVAPPPPPSPAPMTLGQLAPWRYSFDDGSKFAGGYGFTQLLLTDYWTLRQRSSELFETNLYARGLIRRLVTNEINVGLHLEATPEEALLGMAEDALADWSETIENRFQLWSDSPKLCDQTERLTFGAIQAVARMEALVAGDVLVVLRQDQRTGLPRIQLINGAQVQAPYAVELGSGNTIKHGVEVDSTGRHVAYWILQEDRTSKRLPAYGEKSGRRLAWMIYGTDRRMDDVRGKPLLALVLQSLKEVDRYRDSTQRKATVLSMLAMFIEKGENLPGTRPITGGAVRRTAAVAEGSNPADRQFSIAEHVPGLVIEELQTGEKPMAFQTNGTTESFGVFEEAIIQGIAWANEIPPEILTLSFNSNYSASQAAINEFKMYLNKVRTGFGDTFCQPIYVEWLLAETTSKKVAAPGLLEAWRDSAQYDTFAAWVSGDWSGQIKPAVDMSKLVAGYDAMVAGGYITRDRATRELSGTKFSKNIQKLKRENEQLAEANEPIALLEAATKTPPQLGTGEAGKNEAAGQGEDGADDAVEGRGNYPRRRLALLPQN
jgi:lambda family phage portal protein